MKLVTHNVLQGLIMVNDQTIASIDRGLAVFVGFKKGDHLSLLEKPLQQLLNLRIFPDHEGKTNLSIQDIQGDILFIPNFTLHGDTSSRRPSFTDVLGFDEAHALFEASFAYLHALYPKIQKGVFGADMKINLLHDGPFTLSI
jgi:D-tyrosyl-tRNA(Tyr) deacylase